MTIEQKKKELENYNPQDFYTKGAFVDAQDTTNVHIMAKIVAASQNDISVNFDGWSSKWDIVSHINSSIFGFSASMASFCFHGLILEDCVCWYNLSDF